MCVTGRVRNVMLEIADNGGRMHVLQIAKGLQLKGRSGRASAGLLLCFGLALALLLFRAPVAQAQLLPFLGLSNPGDVHLVASRNKRRYYRRPARKKTPARSKPAWYPDEAAKDPVQIIVSLPDQKATIYQGEKALVTSRVSSGKKGYSTPTGVFSILSKNRWHRSNIYSGAPMPFMQRLTWSGIALHASNSVPNHAASHGCLRLPNSFAPQLFRFTQTGIHVIISNKKLTPSEIVHDKLFRPSSPAPGDFDVKEMERQFVLAGGKLEKEKRSTAPLRILVTRRTGKERLMDVQRLLNELQFDAGDVDGWMGPDTAKAIKRFQKTYGLTADGFLSDELIARLHEVLGLPEPSNGHIYVRQAFRRMFDAPAWIVEPEKPLGTHLITAMHFEPGDDVTRWLLLTLDNKAGPLRKEAKARDPETASDAPEIDKPLPEPVTAEQALDRIEISDDVRKRISELLTPGSSLAISDDGLSKETHPKGTDFVVLTK